VGLGGIILLFSLYLFVVVMVGSLFTKKVEEEVEPPVAESLLDRRPRPAGWITGLPG